VGFTSANRFDEFRSPVPAVVKMAPTFTLVLKNAGGKSSRSLNGLAPAPSQLTSRRPDACSPAVPPLAVPRAARNSSTFAAMSPVAVNTVACGGGGGGSIALSSSHAVRSAITANPNHVMLRIVRSPREKV
jgi:hypothetical protein